MVAPATVWLKPREGLTPPWAVQLSPPPLRLPRTRVQQKERGTSRTSAARNSTLCKPNAGTKSAVDEAFDPRFNSGLRFNSGTASALRPWVLIC